MSFKTISLEVVEFQQTNKMSASEQSDSGDWLSTLDAVSGEARDRIRLK